MQDRELVAAIVAGEPGGLGGAYDRYGAPLYAYCRSMLPDPHAPAEAASAVADTFIVATAKLQGLSDPGQLGSWLHAVARNECLRRLGAAGSPRQAPGRPAQADAAGPAMVAAGLREQVLAACADNTPVGRANRASVAHRAGPFGRTGFPVPVVPVGPRWWREARRHPRAVAGVAAVAAAVVLAGTAAMAITGGPHRAQASVVALSGGGFGDLGRVVRPGGRTVIAESQARVGIGIGISHSGEPGVPADGPTRAASPGTSRSPAPERSSASPSRSPSPSPSPPASSSPPPAPGTLQVTPNKLTLSAAAGKTVSGTFIVTAVGGPVNDFTISSANANVTVSPSSGSLGSAGAWVTVTVTAHSKVALRTSLTVDPGKLIVTVLLSIKA